MEFEIKGHEYRISRLGVFEQLKVTRKLLPLLSGLLSGPDGLRAAFTDTGVGPDVFDSVLPRIASELSALSDEDTDAIIQPCLAVVARRNGKNWTPVFRSGELMFDDIDLMVMLRLVARVVADSLGNFLQEPPTGGTPPRN
ncbi:TPA: hypothetical protein JLR02_000789 [Escherichia coli]|nr:hypothetical protein [Escherichia coli]